MRKELKAYTLAAVLMLAATPLSDAALPPQQHLDDDAEQERVNGAPKLPLAQNEFPGGLQLEPWPELGVVLWEGRLLTVPQYYDTLPAFRGDKNRRPAPPSPDTVGTLWGTGQRPLTSR